MKSHSSSNLNQPSCLFEDFLASTDESIALLDTDLRVTHFNDAAEAAFLTLHNNQLEKGRSIFDTVREQDKVMLRSLFAEVLGGSQHTLQRQHDLPNGQRYVFSNRLRPLVRKGAVEGVIIHSRDVTAQYEVEQRLRESNERFTRAANASYDMVWEHDLRQHRIALSEQYARQLGYTETEVDSLAFSAEVIHPDDVEGIRQKVLSFLASKRTHLYYPVHRLRKCNGDYIYVEGHAIVSRDAAGEPYLLTGVTRDVTSRYMMEQKLRDSNRRYELAAHASVDLVFEANVQTGELIHNDIITSVYGFETRELSVTEKSARLIHPEDRALYADAISAALAANETHVHVPLLRLCKKNGDVVYTEVKALLIRDDQGRLLKRVGTARDISWRHRMEQDLYESRQRFERAVEASFDMLWEADLRHDSTYFNARFYSHMGYTPGEIVTRDDFFGKLLHPADQTLMEQELGGFLAGTATFLTLPVYRMRKKDGSFIYAEARVRLTRDDEGRPLLLTGVTRDVTEHRINELELQSLNKKLKRQAAELQQSIDRYELVAKATSDVVWDWDLLSNKNWFSNNFQQLLGYAPEEVGHDINAWISRLHPADSKRILESVETTIHEGRPHWEGEYRFQRADGSWAFIFDRGYTQYDESGAPVRMIGSMQDVTHTRELQEQILRDEVRAQQRITETAIRAQEQERATIGRELHDNVNQILTSCQLMTEMAQREEGLREMLLQRTHTQLGTAIQETRRLSHQLVQPALGEIGLENALRELIDGQAALGTMQVLLRTEGNCTGIDDRTALMLYRIAQEQLQNILKYARATQVHLELQRGEETITLRISDNGIGFDPALRKEGIGLRNMRTRAQLCRGSLELNTAPGAGCTVLVALPAA